MNNRALVEWGGVFRVPRALARFDKDTYTCLLSQSNRVRCTEYITAIESREFREKYEFVNCNNLTRLLESLLKCICVI